MLYRPFWFFDRQSYRWTHKQREHSRQCRAIGGPGRVSPDTASIAIVLTSIAGSRSRGIVLREDRIALGKALRTKVPRTAHAEWKAPADRPDPIKVLQRSDKGRLPESYLPPAEVNSPRPSGLGGVLFERT